VRADTVLATAGDMTEAGEEGGTTFSRLAPHAAVPAASVKASSTQAERLRIVTPPVISGPRSASPPH